MHRHIAAGVAYYTFDLFSSFPGLIHGISTRHGGTSPAPFDTLNLSYDAGDTADNVKANRDGWHRALGLELANTVTARQARSDRVAIATPQDRGIGIPGVDALLTDQAEVGLMLRFADCVPILLYDPGKHAIACVHSGWQGTVMKVVSKAVLAMVDAFGTRTSDLCAGIGPSIGPCCYSVRQDVVSRVKAAFPTSDALLSTMADGTVHLDLWEANALQLRELGVSRIEVAGICTAHRTDEFFSWRAERGQTGRFAATIALAN